MEQLLCQSCGMPMKADNEFGTNLNGSKNEEYCTYCYQQGAFTKDCTMEEMIQECIKHLDEFNKDSEQKFSKEEAITNMKQFFPTLKRWKE